MENKLKDKMDGIPQSFDTEALWKKIEQPKKKERRFLWLFLCGLFMILIAASVFFLRNDAVLKQEVQTVVEQTEKEETKTEQAQTNDYNRKNEDLVSNNKNNKEITQKKITIEKKSAPRLTTKKTKSLNPPFGKQNQFSSFEVAQNFTKISNVPFTDDANSKEDKTQPQSQIIQNEVVIKDDAKKDLEPRKVINELATIETIEIKEFQFSISSPTKARDVDIKNHYQVKNALNLFFGLGYDGHRFSNNTFGNLRGLLESSLITNVIGLSFERSLRKRFFVEPSFSFTISQTNLKITDRNENWSFASTQEVVKAWTETDFNLYNQYYRLDAGLAIGYELSLSKKLSLKPALGLGYNLTSFQSGDFWNMDLERESLKEKVEYNNHTQVFGFGSFKIQYNISQHYSIGMKLEQQMNRMLAKNADYEHQIIPFSAGVYLSRNL